MEIIDTLENEMQLTFNIKYKQFVFKPQHHQHTNTNTYKYTNINKTPLIHLIILNHNHNEEDNCQRCKDLNKNTSHSIGKNRKNCPLIVDLKTHSLHFMKKIQNQAH